MRINKTLTESYMRICTNNAFLWENDWLERKPFHPLACELKYIINLAIFALIHFCSNHQRLWLTSQLQMWSKYYLTIFQLFKMRQKSSDYDKSFFITCLKEKTFQKRTFFCFYFVGLSHCRSNHENFLWNLKTIPNYLKISLMHVKICLHLATLNKKLLQSSFF